MFNIKRIPIWLKLLVSAGLLVFFFTQTDVRTVGEAVLSIPPLTFLAALALSVAAILLNACKWKVLVPSIPLALLARATFVAQYYGLVLPGQILGEVGKAFYVRRHSGLESPEITAMIGLDKVAGLIGAVFVVGSIGALASSYPLPFAVEAAFIGCFLGGVALIFSLRLSAIFRLLTGMLARFNVDQVRRILESWRTFSERSDRIAVSIGLGALYQLLSVAIVMVLAAPLGIHISALDWCWMLSLLSLLLLIPFSIGGLGIREGGLVALLALFGVAAHAALALSLTMFGIQIFLALIGVVYEHMPVKTS